MKSGLLNASTLAENIKKIRMENNLSKIKFSALLGVSYKSVYLWENKLTIPSVANIISICNLFEIKMDDLVGINNF